MHLHLTKNPFAGQPPHLCGVPQVLTVHQAQPFAHGVPSDNALLVLRRLCEKANSFRLKFNKNEATVGTRVYNTDNGAVPTIIQVASETGMSQPDENVKFSLRDAETDRRYMTAVENGDTETAQRMVDEAAEETFKNSEIRRALKMANGCSNTLAKGRLPRCITRPTLNLMCSAWTSWGRTRALKPSKQRPISAYWFNDKGKVSGKRDISA